MDWQQLAALSIVAAAAAGLAGAKLRRRKFGAARAGHCGCSGVSQAAPGGSIIFRARKGERPEVRVKPR